MIQSIELLMPKQAENMWPQLEKLFSLANNKKLTEEIFSKIKQGFCAVFVYYQDKQPKLVIAIQFKQVRSTKIVEILSTVGTSVKEFKDAYWKYIVNWLKANGTKFIEIPDTEYFRNIYGDRPKISRVSSYLRISI